LLLSPETDVKLSAGHGVDLLRGIEGAAMLIDRTVVCFDCKGSLEGAENRRACPWCGSDERAVQIVTAGYIRTADDLTLEFEQSDGAEGTGAVGSVNEEPSQLIIVQREFSPDRNLYIEHVEDEATGTVLWHLESSLTEFARRRQSLQSN
jgi:hypothetical protein